MPADGLPQNVPVRPPAEERHGIRLEGDIVESLAQRPGQRPGDEHDRDRAEKLGPMIDPKPVRRRDGQGIHQAPRVPDEPDLDPRPHHGEEQAETDHPSKRDEMVDDVRKDAPVRDPLGIGTERIDEPFEATEHEGPPRAGMSMDEGAPRAARQAGTARSAAGARVLSRHRTISFMVRETSHLRESRRRVTLPAIEARPPGLSSPIGFRHDPRLGGAIPCRFSNAKSRWRSWSSARRICGPARVGSCSSAARLASARPRFSNISHRPIGGASASFGAAAIP